MQDLIASLASNKAQSIFNAGLKKYVKVGRLLRKISISLLVLQLFFMGIQSGAFLLLTPLLWPSMSKPWIPYLGAALMILCGGLLTYWNSERSWIKRLAIGQAYQAIQDSAKKSESTNTH